MKNCIFCLFILFVVFNHTLYANDNRLYYNQRFAPSEGLIKGPEKASRMEICLNGLWDFAPVALPETYKPGSGIAPDLPLPNRDAWEKVPIKIPSPWNINSFANRNLEGPDHRNYPSYPQSWEDVKMAWMRKKVTIPAGWNDKALFLHFEAVAGFAEVYVNNQKVGENFDLFLPFDVDITSLAKPGEELEILVGVRSQSLFEDRSTLGRRIVPGGSMWGYHVNGIWQDVFLVAKPLIHIEDVFVKPLVSKNKLELEITLVNLTGKNETVTLGGDIRKWLSKAGTDVHTAPLPEWELAPQISLYVPETKLVLPAGEPRLYTLEIPVSETVLEYWSPEYPNLYGLTLTVNGKKQRIDTKYERFGWREWTLDGSRQLLNGKEIQLRGDSWHFMGVPQLTRRYAWAWFQALKDANANAVRPHAQVYPSFYLDVADEMGICVLDETSIWASDGGPKMDSPLFWEACKDHIRRMVLRDRNHASVFGWSISNENKPVILHVFKKPEWMEYQKKAWEEWRDIVMENDPTRPWISSDGEDDGDGLLPVTMGHYGDVNSMKRWQDIGKPWGIGEHSMAYYGTPQQVAKYNGERAYESMAGRMEGIAQECYGLIANQRNLGASYVSVFNLAWYGLQPLPFGKRDLLTPPSLEEDGIFFTDYIEGIPGIQPERMGPYCSTFNPGYDPSLPLYRTWPMFEAVKAANAGESPAWSKWADQPVKEESPETLPVKKYTSVFFAGADESPVKKLFNDQGIVFAAIMKDPENSLVIIDGQEFPSQVQQQMLENAIKKGADCWIWNPAESGLSYYNTLFPYELSLEKRSASSYLPTGKSWMNGLKNSDFYFCEIQQENVSEYGITGSFATEGEVLLEACNTNWRAWNRRPEEIKTAGVLRSENEEKGPDPVFVKLAAGASSFYVSTLDHFVHTEKGYGTLNRLLKNAGLPLTDTFAGENVFDADGTLNKMLKNTENGKTVYTFWIWSPRPLDDLLSEPDMAKLDMYLQGSTEAEVWLNDKKTETDTPATYKTLPLKNGWNYFRVVMPDKDKNKELKVRFRCDNRAGFVKELKSSLYNPDSRSK